jgi:ArsR family transcriptional regulator
MMAMPTTAVSPTRAAELFHALSDPTRLAILDLLGDGEHCVCELQAALDAGQSRLSFHLRVLKDAGLLKDRREGRWAYYRIEPSALVEVHDAAVQMQPGVAGARRGAPIGRCCA